MSEKKDLGRAEQVRLRRESNTSRRVQRARREATRPAPPVTSRTRQAFVTEKRKPVRNATPFASALPAVERTAASSMSTASTTPAPNFAAAMARMPEPQP